MIRPSRTNDRIAFAEDRRMDNVVSLEPDRPRPSRILGVPRSGARILFFTGIRYCRDDAPDLSRADPEGHVLTGPQILDGSERMLDAATH